MQKYFVYLLSIFISISAHAQRDYTQDLANTEKRPPIEHYLLSVFYVRGFCTMAALSSKAGECVNANREGLEKLYKLTASATKKPAKKEALKQHYAQVVTFLDGMEPRIDEIVIDYNRRQSAGEEALKLKETLLKLE